MLSACGAAPGVRHTSHTPSACGLRHSPQDKVAYTTTHRTRATPRSGLTDLPADSAAKGEPSEEPDIVDDAREAGLIREVLRVPKAQGRRVEPEPDGVDGDPEPDE